MLVSDLTDFYHFLGLGYLIYEAILASATNISRWYVYILQSRKTENSKLTYVGKTCDLGRRINQHNCIVSDGKKWTGTRKGIPWQMIAYISGFVSEEQALQFEWRCHHPFNKASRKKNKVKPAVGMSKRVRDLNFILSLDKWTSNSEPNPNLKITWLVPGYQLDVAGVHQIVDVTGRLPKGSKRLNKKVMGSDRKLM